ncbi:MAG: UvrD-helicase domain-containing protein [Micrococcales bacterium]|nr:UvrD-helicase domain-containing protein [Micrococcales bacterium]
MSQLPAAAPLIDLARLPSIQQRWDLTSASPDVHDDGPRHAPRPSVDPAAAQRLLEGLNPEQREAVLHRGGPLLIVAGAGSGKTRVLTHRIAHLLATGEAAPGQILAITFTNKAAAQMRERVVDLVGAPARRMWVSTFHSACVRILRAEAKTLGMTSSFTIYDAEDSLRLLTLVAQGLDLDPKGYPPRVLASRISGFKNELIDPDDLDRAARPSGRNPINEVIGSVYRAYQARLLAANAMDFDDLIMNTVGLFKAFPTIAEGYRLRFRHVFVDEYQDTNHAQYELIRELVKAGEAQEGQLTVVGDADQSIYAFRGATIRNIDEFEGDFPEARTILLEQNYRSTQNILAAANAVIVQNPGRQPKRLWTSGDPGAKVVGYAADTAPDEARFIAEEIDRLGGEYGTRPRDVAVFYRTNSQSRALEEQLMRLGLPYAVVGGTRFYDRREIRDAIAYLRAADNPEDTVSFRRIINVPKRGIGQRAQEKIAAWADKRGISFGAALREDIPDMQPSAAKAIAAFCQLIDKLTEMAANGAGPAALLDEALDASGYIAELDASTDVQDLSRKENLAELHAVAAEFEKTNEGAGLSDFLERVSLVADSDHIPFDDDENAGAGQITLMTLHTAKGLEFPVVFLTGMEDGTLPHARSIADAQELEEERRLAYVGVTRARERLYLTRASTRATWGRFREFAPSRFLSDIPEEVITWERAETSTEVLRRIGEERASAAHTGITRSNKQGGDVAGFGSARPRAEGEIPELSRGDAIVHEVYGPGVVTALEGTGPMATVRVEFPDEGTKRLMLRFAPITKV